MDVTAKLQDGWAWLKGPEPWTRRRVVGESLLAALLMLFAAGIEDLDHQSVLRQVLVALVVAGLSLLRRRLPASVLVVVSAGAAILGGLAPLLVLAGWSAGRRITGVGRALGAFCLAYVLNLGVSVADQPRALPPLVMMLLSTLFFVALVVVPGLASRYWTQRRSLLHALQERNVQLLREREMVAGQARLRERQRIAQDMHDSLGHQLALISVHTGALEVDPQLTDRQRDAVSVLRGASVAAMHELREVVGILRDGTEAPVPSEDAQPAARGVAGLGGLVEVARAAGTEVDLRVLGTQRALPAACDHAAYRIVQEALTNAYKYAPGAAITVELRYEPDSLVVEVANGPIGSGQAPGLATLVSGGQGLTGLRERARLVGGMVHAGATEHGGFRVAGMLPYGAEATQPVVNAVAGADDFRQQSRPSKGSGGEVDWAAVEQDFVRRERGGRSGFLVGCGLSLVVMVGVLVLLGVAFFMLAGSLDEAMISKEEYDQVRVGESERQVRERLPSGDTALVAGLEGTGPPKPPGSACLVLMSSEDGSSFTAEPVFRFCFKDGKLVEKKAYETER
ncbi:sensor histidine kinase [Streptomyces sp. NPDC006879]|uniref:sensor histidine kinase n=1 Tax=Streptomyces sp. NPDC006879 TaxID=3364767 RepID=UPI0036AB6356